MKVKFLPQNIEFDIKAGETVLHVAQDNGIYIKSVCRGVPSCAECRVRVIDGDHNVTPPASSELGLIGTGHFIDHRRLSCQLRCFGDITIDLTEQLEKEQKIKAGLDKARPNNREESIGQSGMYGSILAETVGDVGNAQIESELLKEEQEIKARENSQRRNQNQPRSQGAQGAQGGQPRGNQNQRRNKNRRRGNPSGGGNAGGGGQGGGPSSGPRPVRGPTRGPDRNGGNNS